MTDTSIDPWVNARFSDIDVVECASLQISFLRERTRFRDFLILVKRAADIFVASMALLVLSPFLLCIAAGIKLDSRGPIFFVQRRWGKDCAVINVLKFRTMHVQACDPTGVAQTVLNDPRISRIGGYLRKWNIDELPQLVNVIKGDMSLVGPRCHPIGMLAAGVPYEELVPNYHLRHRMRPGITGLAQMHGLRGPTVDIDKAMRRFQCDAFYVMHFSLWMDLKIIVGTIRREIFSGGGF